MLILSRILVFLLLSTAALADGFQFGGSTGSLGMALGGGISSGGGGSGPIINTCTGGTRTTSGGTQIITFTASGTLTCPAGFTATELLVVGGGGGATVGGGGGGGVIDATSVAIPSGASTVTVGAGGLGSNQGSNAAGNPGGNSGVAGVTIPSAGYTTQVFNCTGFQNPSGGTSGLCGMSLIGGSGLPFALVGGPNGSSPGLSGTQILLMAANATHAALNVNYQTVVNVQKFQATTQFIPNGWNYSITFNNTVSGSAGNTGPNFAQGAGCEASFFQGFPYLSVPSFAVELDQYSSLTAGGSTFTYSSAQIYTPGVGTPPNAPNPPGVSPCNPDLGGSGFTYVGVNKVSTSPVPLNSPATTVNTTTGDTYSLTITYDGSNFTTDLYDITASGTCTPVTSGTCFHNVWTGVNIPGAVGANTAYVGLASATNVSVTTPMLVNTFTYFIPTPSAATAIGGGAGGTNNDGTPAAGGSGGGCGGNAGGCAGGSGTPGQGNAGGTAPTGGDNPGGGGGGCSAAGTNGTSTTVAGNGGNGCTSSISGTAVNYGCGGAGGLYSVGGTVGTRGCANAGTASNTNGVAGGAGVANTGGGGGAGNSGGALSGAGGSGVVIISCPINSC